MRLCLNRTRTLVFLPLFLLVLALTACNTSSGPISTVDVDGSSTVFPITEAMAEEFQNVDRNTHVVVGISGTGGGFKRFCRGETHMNNASRTIKASEVVLCGENNIEYIELAVAYDGLAVVTHAENDWVDYLTVEELNKMWEPAAQGVITNWNQIREEWPDSPLNLYGAGVDSGTYDYFTEAITGEGGLSRGDFVASEDDNVIVQGISNDKYSLGFFGYAYYKENQDKLKVIPIVDAGKTPKEAVKPTIETINDGSYTPLSRPLFVYVTKDATTNVAVDAFVQFYIETSNAEALVTEVGYVPLPAELYELVQKRYEAKVTGSLYEGHEADSGLEDLLRNTAT